MKSGTGACVTESDTVVEWASAPLVPVIVNVYVPAGVVPSVVNDSGEFAEPPAAGVTLAGEKLPAAPDGKPLTERLVADEKPFTLVTVAV